jgi:mono/diheme cytochrome c family protein
MIAIALGACRGQPSQSEPIHLIGDMDWQPKYQPEEDSPLWQDGRAQRPLMEGVVAQGHLDEDDGYYKGKVGELYVARAPITVDEKVIRRGQDRFNIYCTPCHDRTGGGQGLAVKRGYPQPVSLVSDRVLLMPDGQVFETITHGVRNMPAYRKQVPVEDRWAIVTWVRVLGRAANSKLADVPADLQNRIEPEEVQQ